MNYIDFAIAVSFFLFFFAAVIMFSTNYFSNLSGLTKTSEFRPVSENLFKLFFERKGVPENWDENYFIPPVKVGLMEDLYMVPILVKETNGSDRTDEPVSVRIIFDEDCQNKSWNTTVRMYDEDWNEINLEISNTTFCISQFLNQSDITWEVNISANQAKKYYVYYSPDDDVTDPSYAPLSYNTSSWIPSDGDNWTETTTNWTQFEGLESQLPTNDTVIKIRGNSSVSITLNFSVNSKMGLNYDRTANTITGVSNDWYLDVWLYVDDMNDISAVYVEVIEPDAYAYTNISDEITSGAWYHFVRQLDPSLWEIGTYPWGDGTFNASRGIDWFVFYLENGTEISERTVKVDGLHFKKEPLEAKAFPEEHINAFSSSKFDALKNISYDESRKLIGENYKFRIEVSEDTYGGNMNKSANVGCYESPRIVENKNGTIAKVMAKMCVWK